jgi:ketosteroid isomerase-like protein
MSRSEPPLIQKRRRTLEAFSKAWAEKNVAALLELITDDCVYCASVGPEPGRTYRGKADVGVGICSMFAHDHGSSSSVTNLRFGDDHAYWEWHYLSDDGRAANSHSHGCDLFLFEGDKIALKQAFRKVQSE